jgi:uncharacterized membrane protein YeaQ/YmgE (transglycosylase-associated protein family)
MVRQRASAGVLGVLGVVVLGLVIARVPEMVFALVDGGPHHAHAALFLFSFVGATFIVFALGAVWVLLTRRTRATHPE